MLSTAVAPRCLVPGVKVLCSARRLWDAGGEGVRVYQYGLFTSVQPWEQGRSRKALRIPYAEKVHQEI